MQIKDFPYTGANSITGMVLYSDIYYTHVQSQDPSQEFRLMDRMPYVKRVSWLCKLAYWPPFNSIFGTLRIALAILHTVGHLLVYAKSRNIGHTYHAIKGGAELLRGIIEIIPLIGGILMMWYDCPRNYGYNTQKNMKHYWLVSVQMSKPED